jgi:predicted enzyme related to lactoylglutathione lyase
MSERDGFEPGVPCWVDTMRVDPAQAVSFYTELFGWEAKEVPSDASGPFFLFNLRGRNVAGAGSHPPGGSHAPPHWGTYIWVDSADDAAGKVAGAGGTVLEEPFDVGDAAARIAVLADPSGAVFRVWQPYEAKGAQLVNEPGAWSMSQLNTRDPDGSKDFYGAVFGWTTEAMDMGGAEITLWRLPGFEGGEEEQPVSRETVGVMVPMSVDQFPDDVPPHWSVDFWVDDADATAERAAELGGKVIAPPFDTPGFRQAVLADPEGASFSVTQLTAGE